ncbi:MAG: type II toxin-antitoxin system HicB family antitoxin [Acidobacteria bacterium]|nr:type II toxin-antitoxin system HicB family antitoxin [Acidobacteriota bacterium]
MTRTAAYSAVFERDPSGGFVITLPDFGWGVTQADTEEAAHEMARELILDLAQYHIRHGEPVPIPRRRAQTNTRLVFIPLVAAAKIELYRQLQKAGLRKADLGRLMGMAAPNVERLFRLRHPSRIESIEAAFRVLGKEIGLEVRNAA